MQNLTGIITGTDPALRDQSLDALCAGMSLERLLDQCDQLDAFRRQSDNLYERVRALFFLYAIHRFHLPLKAGMAARGLVPFKGYEHLLQRRFEEAIDQFLAAQSAGGPSDAISSALAAAYHRLAFQTLADQVRRSVRSVRGNQWMFRMGHPQDHPLRIRRELLRRAGGSGAGVSPASPGVSPANVDSRESDRGRDARAAGWKPAPLLAGGTPALLLSEEGGYPILCERTPVRMDLTHSGWSDIFFLGMDFPEGARVLNVSIDLAVHGRDRSPQPPVEAYLRVIEEPVLRLTSVDLGATAEITQLSDVFDFAKDYLGLLKAAVIAAGLVPPGIEGSGQSLGDLLARLVGPGRGLEIVSNVNNIPKGSRLAVSTNLLAALISVCMRATGQAESLTGPLQEHERRLVLARAILGEWLGGSGGGWQDSGGVWPGIKLIQGVLAGNGDAEFGISRGRLMPTHRILDSQDAPAEARRKLQESLLLVHGGMAQNVGPILEMVTEKYLLRSEAEWKGRREALGILDEVLAALRSGDIRALGVATTRNFEQPIQSIIPWASTAYTETLIERVRAEFGPSFWGFWMLGGMSGGGMGFIFDPEKKERAQQRLQEIMSSAKREWQDALPFAMEPVVYDFAINERGTFAALLEGEDALMPPGYYALTVPQLLRQELRSLSPLRRSELDKFGAACRTKPELRGMVQTLFDAMLPRGKAEATGENPLSTLLDQHGFDRTQHEQIRADLKSGRIGLAQNRLPANAVIEDVRPEDVVDATGWIVGQASRLPHSRAAVPAAPAGVSPAKVGLTKSVRGRDARAAGGTPAPLPFRAFDQHRPASIHSRRLPHWQQEGVTYFVTFRLADALPQTVLRQWEREREEWLRGHPEPRSPAQLEELKELFQAKLEEQLDLGYGASVLKESAVADIAEGALHHFDGERYWLGSYVLMPNHVHALVRPLMQHKLPDILHSWKSFTGHEINKALGRTGTLWQDESFDHIVRDETQLERFGRYIIENPTRARLAAGSSRVGGGLATRQAGGTGSVSGAAVSAAPSGVSPAKVDSTKSVRGRDARAAGGTPAPLTLASLREAGLAALRNGEVAVVTLSAGAGSRWTQGAGVVKALHPFCKLSGRHRTFIETHLAKSRRVSHLAGIPLPHIFTTSYLTHEPTTRFLARQNNYGYEGPLFLSPGKSVGLRMIPTVRDLRFAWEEMPQQLLDEQQQKVRDSLHAALIGWARQAGEAGDYTDNLLLQCLHPVGHWYEIPNLFRNGVLARLLAERPQVKHLLLHNIDTLGADADPALLGQHIQSGAGLTFEVITRRIEDRGGGLARVNGRVRLVEGLAMPREEAEFVLSYYNSMTTWIDLDKFLAAFGLSRPDLANEEKVTHAIRHLAAKMPTYITLKEVKKRWGHGQEDIFPVTQFEKLWSDLTALPEIESRFVVVPRLRGQQLKDQAQLDGWLRDGSAAYVESLCEWS